MRDRVLEERLRRWLGREIVPERLEETVSLCRGLTEERAFAPMEPRTGFWGFLSAVFRFDGLLLLGMQAAALVLVGLHVCSAAGRLEYLPAYGPVFVLAVVPAFFRGQYHRVSELEAAARASGAQLALARLVLAGAADLICMTALLGAEVCLRGSARALGRMVLYCLSPYLLCMAVMLRCIRREKRSGMPLSAVAALASCGFWRGSSRLWPWLYEVSAAGVWGVAFVVFSAFFAREICFIIQANREGKMYGAVL